MHFVYLLNQRFPTEKAHGRQVFKMSSNFADIPGIDLELIYPIRRNHIKDDVFEYYGVKKDFKLSRIWTPDFYLPGRLESLVFGLKSSFSAIILAGVVLIKKPEIVYSRDELSLYILSFFRKNLIFEIHKIHDSRTFMYRRFRKSNLRIIAISSSLRDTLIELGFKPSRILVAPDGVDAEVIEKEDKHPSDNTSARRILDLPLDKKIIVYTGSLYRWKGVYTLVDAAKLAPDTMFVIVGGDERGDETELRHYIKENNIENVVITGYIKSEKTVRNYLSTANVLVLPNTAKDKVSERYTSPLKLFSYMAARRPIVASDLPSLKEILNEKNAILVRADDAKALANGIRKVLDDSSLSDQISHSAFENVRQHTWENRATNILNFLN